MTIETIAHLSERLEWLADRVLDLPAHQHTHAQVLVEQLEGLVDPTQETPTHDHTR